MENSYHSEKNDQTDPSSIVTLDAVWNFIIVIVLGLNGSVCGNLKFEALKYSEYRVYELSGRATRIFEEKTLHIVVEKSLRTQ